MSERPRKNAIRVANVPEEQFNGQVESDTPNRESSRVRARKSRLQVGPAHPSRLLRPAR
jgi:hypothetical protein